MLQALRRHATRPQRTQFAAEEMQQWYKERDLLPDDCETIIGQDGPLEATVQHVLRASGLSEPRVIVSDGQ
ncbi:hypothetical protein [Planomonospora parontospora]|uniref:hypothetical protein n=1 Tax=Planomonospora parontospora TaxID=58119 RepID=UPI0019409939|nr:hypothetical protein [Planomonospora parontospora]GGL54778.1 hypothetical protein GCM10014719_65100 [Planomonospora parontospora subsp. antibiotica]GII19273.1 hypothetical protein Ppa05_59990 [Planomonospora parontospora subsp. antibiotica]